MHIICPHCGAAASKNAPKCSNCDGELVAYANGTAEGVGDKWLGFLNATAIWVLIIGLIISFALFFQVVWIEVPSLGLRAPERVFSWVGMGTVFGVLLPTFGWFAIMQSLKFVLAYLQSIEGRATYQVNHTIAKDTPTE